MSKYSNFERIERDCYDTIDKRAFQALQPHLSKELKYYDPCAGKGVLIEGFIELGFEFYGGSDIAPRADWIAEKCVFEIDGTESGADYYLTNSPFNRRGALIANDIAIHLSNIKPTWMLLPSDYACNDYFSQFEGRFVRQVHIGRLIWIEGTNTAGKENFSWYLFDKPMPNRQATVHLRRSA